MKKIIIMILAISSFMSNANEGKDHQANNEIKKLIADFAKKMAAEHDFNEKEVYSKFVNMPPNDVIIGKISKPAESMSWYNYEKIWMTDERINDGVKFWDTHEALLNKAQEVYGVEPEIIVGIIGVETFFGKSQGTFAVVDALNTLGFYYPPRADFFRKELEEFLVLAKNQGWSLDDIYGSYAGAMGMGQFISSSYRNYAVDFNQDGKINLFSDPADAIGSVANYFKSFGWQTGGYIAQPIKLSKKQLALVQKKLELQFTAADLKKHKIRAKNLNTSKLGIFAFEASESKNEHWLAGDNFYVITRYNHNAMYARAVLQVSRAIKAKRTAAKN
ncbi:MAG: lytic murein transglycosylase B [Gammaproteobacteria bacterium]|nr:lytic murein transglycosylase B [Gammaproteobacteria bacterium]MDH5629634.1 lytic murein transglycosylase B [Gammaproteobacteria bacterium]